MWGLLIFAVILSAVFASEIFWELLCGLALLTTIAAVIQFEPAMIATGLLLLGACCFRWARVA